MTSTTKPLLVLDWGIEFKTVLIGRYADGSFFSVGPRSYFMEGVTYSYEEHTFDPKTGVILSV